MYLILYNTISSDLDSSTTIVSGVKRRRTTKNITPVINGVSNKIIPKPIQLYNLFICSGQWKQVVR